MFHSLTNLRPPQKRGEVGTVAVCLKCGGFELIGSDDCRNCHENFNERRPATAREIVETYGKEVTRRTAVEGEVEQETLRWQDGIRDKLISLGVPDNLIDGAGCDSGDPLDFTLAEISQGVAFFSGEVEQLRALLSEKLKERDGTWIDKMGACKVCDGEIPYGHISSCDIWKLEQSVEQLRKALEEARGALGGMLASAGSDTEVDTKRLDWLEDIIRPDACYCEIFFAGLRNWTGNAHAFQIESNPELFKTLNAPTLRAAIDGARGVTSVSPVPEAGSKDKI